MVVVVYCHSYCPIFASRALEDFYYPGILYVIWVNNKNALEYDLHVLKCSEKQVNGEALNLWQVVLLCLLVSLGEPRECPTVCIFSSPNTVCLPLAYSLQRMFKTYISRENMGLIQCFSLIRRLFGEKTEMLSWIASSLLLREYLSGSDSFPFYCLWKTELSKAGINL